MNVWVNRKYKEEYRQHLEKIAEIWAGYEADPEKRCPRCGRVSGLPKRLGMDCFRCGMRYSPVTSERFGRDCESGAD